MSKTLRKTLSVCINHLLRAPFDHLPQSAARHMARAIKALEQHLPTTATLAWDALHAIAPTA
jgi:hypothetical protein